MAAEKNIFYIYALSENTVHALCAVLCNSLLIVHYMCKKYLYVEYVCLFCGKKMALAKVENFGTIHNLNTVHCIRKLFFECVQYQTVYGFTGGRIMANAGTKVSSTGNAVSILTGATFLMATSAIGPGFLTQTAMFTEQLMAAFGFAILISVIIDIIIQTNIWRILGVSGMRAQDVANKVIPGLGFFLAFAVCMGGLFFNIGNVGGAALGLDVLFGLPHAIGAIISAAVAIALFLGKEFGPVIDKFVKVLGVIMIGLVLVIVVKTGPPIALAVQETVAPSKIDWFIVLTLVGGTVGGYLSFTGVHRIIDGGVTGHENIKQITWGSISAIVTTGIMRYLMFLAILGVVVTGAKLDPSNPAAAAFRIGAGELGYKFFGVVLWSAAVTSVVGCSYTSVSFLRTLSPMVENNYRYWIIGFILLSTTVFVTIGRPALVLVAVGSLNGMILPLSLISVLLAAYKKEIVGDYKHPMWMTALGYLMVVFTAWMSFKGLGGLMKLING